MNELETQAKRLLEIIDREGIIDHVTHEGPIQDLRDALTPAPSDDKEIKLELSDASYPDKKLNVTVKLERASIEIYPEGYSQFDTSDDAGGLIYVELCDDMLKVGTFSDINDEEPFVINMEGARDNNRKEETDV